MSEFLFAIEDIVLRERSVKFRMPFRFGIVTLREAPEAIVSVRIRTSTGSTHLGMSADLMAPKWFDKNPELSNQQNVDQLRQSVKLASDQYLMEHKLNTAFGHHANHTHNHYSNCTSAGLNNLIAGFGTALVDRAILDACCRAVGLSFFEAIQTNLPAITAQTTPDLVAFDITRFLSTLSPASHIQVRHTVGLTDAITDTEISPTDVISDGLPQSLAANCAAYGLRAFKLKACGVVEDDLERLLAITSVLKCLPEPYTCTLDGNEQYENIEEFGELWAKIGEDRHLAKLKAAIEFVEQPITRKTALTKKLSQLGEEIAFEIDESDANIMAFPLAKSLGYRGTSSKSCKGVYRSLLNRARIEMWNSEIGKPQFFMSAEDLSTQAGIALQQDLSLATLIGCNNVERNGHQYGDGFSGAAISHREALVVDHPDLYVLSKNRANLKIDNGYISLKSLNFPGYGTRRQFQAFSY